MNPRHLRLVAGLDARFHFTRPLFWVLLVLLVATSLGLSSGNVSMQSGDTSIGGDEQAWLTSEYSNALMLPMVTFLFYSFFVAVAAGMAIPRDDELNVGPIVHSTRLRPAEYMWGKFGAVLGLFLIVLAIHLLAAMFFNHLWPHADAERIRGPFQLVNYLRPAMFMALPFVVFLCGTSFAVGAITRRPILVFVMPVALFLVSIFFLWDWSPSDLDPGVNRLLMWLEPSAFRWINETWIKVDRGVAFYNREPVGYDTAFLVSRLVWAAVGLLAVIVAERHFAATVRASHRVRRRRGTIEAPPATAPRAVPTTKPMAELEMSARPPGFLRTVLNVARFEGRNLASQPGLYIFVPLILLQVVFSFDQERGAFDTPLLLTPGMAATLGMGLMTTLVCLLLLFYTAESVLREQRVRLHPMFWAAPMRTSAVLLGKAIANAWIGVLIIAAAIAGSMLVILSQGQVSPDLGPFLTIWGLLLVPTLIAWTSFVAFTVALTGSRYGAYAIGLSAILFTAWRNFHGEMNWVGNWALWGSTTWTDFGGLAPNDTAFLLNRLFWLAVAAFLVALTVRFFPRRERDSGATLDRLRPLRLLVAALRLAPVALPALVIGSVLWVNVKNGAQGDDVERREKEYWGRNLLTWGEAPTPVVAGVDFDLALDPAASSFEVSGHYLLHNRHDEPIRRFPMSVGDHFEDVTWKLNGADVEPEHSARLFVFTPDEPLAPGDTLRVDFAHRGALPAGLTVNGGGMGTFILECGVVLTSFNTDFLPVPWFEEGRGQDEDNQTDPRTYEDGFWEGVTQPAFGGGALYNVRSRISGPEEYRYHGVGVLREDTVRDGVRTMVWESDAPVNFFNVVAGKWDVRRGDGVEVWHHPGHTYNLDEIVEALEGSRRHYSEWFYPYPWQDLRLNEFPALASYAQGFPTNITFSESIGFLTRSTPETQAAFLVTAHEAAHQWWGNLLLPGEGPGGNILSEGMAHYSTILLMGEMKGERDRIEFCKRIEDGYGEDRQVNSERPMVRVDGSRAGDTTIQYDKGGWVFWMLQQEMGDAAMFAGVRDFIGRYHGNPDHPVLQDFLTVMREHAPDAAAFDAFADQWFLDVVLPEYRVSDARVSGGDGAWTVSATLENVGTGTMTVDVAATAGVRFPDEGEESSWREQRRRVRIGARETVELIWETDFPPEEIVVDPDAHVLMLERARARADLDAGV